MITAIEKRITRSPIPNLKCVFTIGCGVVLFLVTVCIGLYFWTLRGGGAEPATATLAEKVTSEFVRTLRNEDVEATRQMFSEKVRSGISAEDITRVWGADENRTVFATYRSFEVCDWGVFVTGEGHLISATGLIHYQNGDVVFESNLRKDSDSIWRIYGFWLKPEVAPQPFGRCH